MLGFMADILEFQAKMSSQGRLVLPVAVRHALDLQTGDTLSLSLDNDGVVRIVTARRLATNLWDAFASPEQPQGTAAAELSDIRAADAELAEAKFAAISERRASVERSDDELTAELMTDLGLADLA
jgi:AbrB family looped-hinge helix DNA binding protein